MVCDGQLATTFFNFGLSRPLQLHLEAEQYLMLASREAVNVKRIVALPHIDISSESLWRPIRSIPCLRQRRLKTSCVNTVKKTCRTCHL